MTDGRGPRPTALDRLRAVELDVREDIARGAEPLARIMQRVRALTEDEALHLRVPFEPLPLYDVLKRRGFTHWTEHGTPGDWSVWFYRAVTHAAERARETPSALTLDVRGLEPPLPMVSVLQRLEELEPGQTLEVMHDRRPMFLYPQLDERGFQHETHEAEPGVIRIRIHHPAR